MNAPVPRNPFTGEIIAKPSEGGGRALTAQAHTDQQRAIAEVQASMMIARANPRNPIEAMDRIMNACTRPTLAERALYTYARGGTDISGPSIRLAEAVAQQWGNMQFGIRELDQRPDMSTVQAFAWDVETNTRREVTFQVPLIRHTKKGAYRLEDPRDIYEMVANQGARRLRACILSIIPGDVIEAAVAQCEATLSAKADASPETVQKMITAFAEFGVTKEQIEKRIQRRLDAIQPAQVVSLKKVYASLRDGMSTPAEWFEDVAAPDQAAKPEAASKIDAVKDKIKAKAHAAAAGAADNSVPEFSAADAMELGREHRRQNKPRRAPPEWTDAGWQEAYVEGWNEQDTAGASA